MVDLMLVTMRDISLPLHGLHDGWYVARHGLMASPLRLTHFRPSRFGRDITLAAEGNPAYADQHRAGRDG